MKVGDSVNVTALLVPEAVPPAPGVSDVMSKIGSAEVDDVVPDKTNNATKMVRNRMLLLLAG